MMPRHPNAAPTAAAEASVQLPGVPQLVRNLAERCARREEEEDNAAADLQAWGSAVVLARGEREETAVPEAHRARLQRRAFNILLNYDEVDYPYVSDERREKLNMEHMTQAFMDLMETNRPSEGRRLQELCSALQSRTEVLLLPEQQRRSNMEDSAPNLLDGSVVPLQEPSALLSLLLLLQGTGGSHSQEETELHEAAGAASCLEELIPGASGWDLGALAAEGAGPGGEPSSPQRRWGAPAPAMFHRAFGPPSPGFPVVPTAFPYEVEEPDDASSALPASPAASLPLGISINTLDTSLGSLHPAGGAQTSLSASASQLGGSLLGSSGLWGPGEVGLGSFRLGLPKPDDRAARGSSVRSSVASLTGALHWNTERPTAADPYSLMLSESEPPSLRTSVAGSVPASPSSRRPGTAGSFRFPGAFSRPPLTPPRGHGRRPRGSRPEAPSQVLVKPAEAEPAESGALTGAPGPWLQRVTTISEEAVVRLGLLGMQGVEAALEQLTSGLLATPTLGAGATAALLRPVAASGRRCIRLRAFVALHGSLPCGGGAQPDPCLAAFSNAVGDFLSQHVAALQALKEATQERREAEGKASGAPGAIRRGIPVTLLELCIQTDNIQSHLRCLAEICQCEPAAKGEEEDEEERSRSVFPGGAELLSHLYAALKAAEGPSAGLLRWLFAAAFKPFMDHARGWLYTPVPVPPAWSCGGGPHLSGLRHPAHACAARLMKTAPQGGSIGGAAAAAASSSSSGSISRGSEGFPRALPSCLEGVEREFLLAGLQLRVLASLGVCSGLAERMRSLSEAEATEAAAFAASCGSGGYFSGSTSAAWSWEAPGGSMPIIFESSALRGLCTIQENAAKERAGEAEQTLKGLEERRNLLKSAAAAETLEKAEAREEARAAARAAKAREAAERRARQAELLRAQTAAISEKEAQRRAAEEAEIREEQELIERSVRMEHAALLAEVASQQADSLAATRRIEEQSRRLDWRSARWQLSGARRALLLSSQAAGEAELAELLRSGSRRAEPAPRPATRPPGAPGPRPSEAAALAPVVQEARGIAEEADEDKEGGGAEEEASGREPMVEEQEGNGTGVVQVEEEEEGVGDGDGDGDGLGAEGGAEGLGVGAAERGDGRKAGPEEAGRAGRGRSLEEEVREGMRELEGAAGEPRQMEEGPDEEHPLEHTEEEDKAGSMGLGGRQGDSEESAGATAAAGGSWGLPGILFGAVDDSAVAGPAAPAVAAAAAPRRRWVKPEAARGGGGPAWGATAAEAQGFEEHGAMPVEASLEALVSRGVVAQYRCISGMALRVLETEFNLRSYFQALGRLFFLQSGDFAGQLLQEVAAVARSGRPLCSTEAQAILEAALRESSAAEEGAMPGETRLRILEEGREEEDEDEEFKPRDGEDEEEEARVVIDEDDIHSLSAVALTHTPPWPLSVVVSPSSLKSYSNITAVLLRFRRAKGALLQIWHLLRSVQGGRTLEEAVRRARDAELSRSGAADEAVAPPPRLSLMIVEAKNRLQQLLLFRHEAEHFTSTIEGFVHMQLQGAVASGFQAALEGSGDLAEVAHAHDEFVAAAAHASMLGPSNSTYFNYVFNALQELLHIRALLLDPSSDLGAKLATKESWGRCRERMSSFRRHSAFLMIVVKKLAGQKRPMGDLSHAFSINSYYASAHSS